VAEAPPRPLPSAGAEPRDARGRADDAGVAAPAAAARYGVEGRALVRGGRKQVPRGVTYGPFPANAAGEPFPEPITVAADFGLMRRFAIDAVRTYCVPPAWFLERARADGISILADIPWGKHLCFMDSRHARDEARAAVQRAAEACRGSPALLGYSIGNEIPAEIVRWHGAGRVAAFLASLADTARRADPGALVTYANFPPTEYLELPFLDFATFNVYLHDLGAFRRYLLRLQNLVGDVPLVLGELGMDTLRHGEEGQAAFLDGHLREADLLGLAGSFVFAWTDLWHTGGHLVEDWRFGITRADRTPKPACHAVARLATTGRAGLLAARPRVSVVVCSYQGGRTLAQCLESLGGLDYPDYEVILVDDGSTDDTPAIARRFPEVRVVRHETNLGLSASRNAGLAVATGAIVAYTDSDCFADPDWLTHLVHRLESTGADAVGGPNIAPDDGWLAASIAASPGQPTHVLESDQEAEHVPGCNMAFRRGALEEINGFDPQFLRAGDDVDVCWRLQQAGHWITFAPGAVVWHHRRQTPRAYLRQQSGYGEAEALLRFKHPEKFNGRGGWKWRGVLYGASLRGLHLREALVYRGTFGTGFFQCLYQPPAAHWAMVPASLEWHIAAAFALVNALVWRPAGIVALAMLGLSLAVALLQAVQARLPARHDGPGARATVAALSYVQPLVRALAHYRTRLSSYAAITAHPTEHGVHRHWNWWRGRDETDWWAERGGDRTRLLGDAIAALRADRWGVTLDTGWSEWDARVFGHPWTSLEVTTVQEEHGSGRRLVRLRSRLRFTWVAWAALAAAASSVSLALAWNPAVGAALAGITVLAALAIRGRGVRLAAQIAEAFDDAAAELGFVPCPVRGTARES
ncbi:MAG: glycosyltransferase, partial [Planctomycetes bacterium]|nr:glycosyltransferase [Planctomycetota bacterium]